MWFYSVVIDMKENVKIFLIALVIGMVVAFLISFKYKDDVAFAFQTSATMFCLGTYNDEQIALEKSKNYPHSIVYQNNGTYQVIIGIYVDDVVCKLISSYYRDLGLYFDTEKIDVSGKFLEEIKSLEVLIKTGDEHYYENVNTSILNLFSEYMLENS